MNEKHISYDDNLRCQVEKQWAVLNIKNRICCDFIQVIYYC